MNKPMILIVEDDKAICNLMKTTLETQGYHYIIAQTGKAAILEVTTHRPDMMILDLGLPDMDGLDIIKKVRTWSNLPIIVVSARGNDRDKIEALDAGADDYLTKPFSVEELLARLRVSLRRLFYSNSTTGDNGAVFINGDLKIEYEAGCVFLKDEAIHVTPIEYRLLCLLAKNVGKVLTQNYISKEIWGGISSEETPSLRVFMATLRKKLKEKPTEPTYIQTHIGVGYRMLRVEKK